MAKKFVLMLVVLAMVLASCAPGASSPDEMMDPQPTEKMMEEGMPDTGSEDMPHSTAAPPMDQDTMDPQAAETMMDEAMPNTGAEDAMQPTDDPEMMEPEAGEMDAMAAPTWFGVEMIDAASGETFRIEDFEGKVVLLEPFAQWCSTCLSQQREVVRLHQLLGMPDDLVSVSLDIDPNEDADMLQTYLDRHGFDWKFAIASPDTIREIGSLYGAQFLNPPSAPMMIIDRKGEVHTLPFGIKSAEALQEALKPYLDSGM